MVIESSYNVEDKYPDVLQNIEMGVVFAFRQHPELADYNVDSALEALIRNYRREGRNRAPQVPTSPLTHTVYLQIRHVCEWRLGREQIFTDEEGNPLDMEIEPLTIDEIIVCLKRLRKSVKFWSSEGGRQGYLNYISQFL